MNIVLKVRIVHYLCAKSDPVYIGNGGELFIKKAIPTKVRIAF
ncbi:hypothetical protein HNR77_003985 [Paenibacillus sp. JGP012]|nr:hypothetical protein [Paenibacillus sp. JGP012]